MPAAAPTIVCFEGMMTSIQNRATVLRLTLDESAGTIVEEWTHATGAVGRPIAVTLELTVAGTAITRIDQPTIGVLVGSGEVRGEAWPWTGWIVRTPEMTYETELTRTTVRQTLFNIGLNRQMGVRELARIDCSRLAAAIARF